MLFGGPERRKVVCGLVVSLQRDVRHDCGEIGTVENTEERKWSCSSVGQFAAHEAESCVELIEGQAWLKRGAGAIISTRERLIELSSCSSRFVILLLFCSAVSKPK